MTSLNQKIVRRLRNVLSTRQQEYFARVFIYCENDVKVRKELGCNDSFESQLLRTLRQRIGQRGDSHG